MRELATESDKYSKYSLERFKAVAEALSDKETDACIGNLSNPECVEILQRKWSSLDALAKNYKDSGRIWSLNPLKFFQNVKNLFSVLNEWFTITGERSLYP